MIVPPNLVPIKVCPFGDDCAAPGAIHLYPNDRDLLMLVEQTYIRNIIRSQGTDIFHQVPK